MDAIIKLGFRPPAAGSVVRIDGEPHRIGSTFPPGHAGPGEWLVTVTPAAGAAVAEEPELAPTAHCA